MAERLGLPAPRLAVQTEALEEGEQVLGGEHEFQPDLVGGELAEGKQRSPVSLPQRMRSSTRAWPRWRASSWARSASSWSVMKTWKRKPWWSVKVS